MMNSIDKRKYWEVWGDSLQNTEFLKKITLGLTLIIILLLILLNQAMHKDPLVIRLDHVGRAEPIKSISTTHELTPPEILNFTKLFMKYFMERNFYTWDDNLIEAGNMMTKEYREKINSEIDFDQELENLKVNELTSKLELSDISVLRDTVDHLIIGVKGWRVLTSYSNKEFRKELIFDCELVLKKVARTSETPYGLLVDSFQQKIFKNE